MTKKNLVMYGVICLLLIIQPVMSFAQEVWTYKLYDSGYIGYKKVIEGPKGVYTAVGSSALTNLPGTQNAGGMDSLITNYASDGTVNWHVMTGTPGDDFLKAICYSTEGYYIAGGTNGTVLKISLDGTVIWENQYPDYGRIHTIVERDPGQFVLGTSNTLVMIDTNGNELDRSPVLSQETYKGHDGGFFTCKYGDFKVYDKNFNLLWAKMRTTTQTPVSAKDYTDAVITENGYAVIWNKFTVTQGRIPGQMIRSEGGLNLYDKHGRIISSKTLLYVTEIGHTYKIGATMAKGPDNSLFYVTYNQDNQSKVTYYDDRLNVIETFSIPDCNKTSVIYTSDNNLVVTGNTLSAVGLYTGKHKIPTTTYINLARNKKVYTSSDYAPEYAGANAVDGQASTLWGTLSEGKKQWIYVDLGLIYEITMLKVRWFDNYFPAHYSIGTSRDGITWDIIHTEYNGNGNVDYIQKPATGRYVGILIEESTKAAYGLSEFEVLKR